MARLTHGRRIRRFDDGRSATRLAVGMCCIFETSRGAALRAGLPVFHQIQLAPCGDCHPSRVMCDRRHWQSPNRPPPRNDQAEEQARFVVMQHLTAISHAERLMLVLAPFPIGSTIAPAAGLAYQCSASPASIRLGLSLDAPVRAEHSVSLSRLRPIRCWSIPVVGSLASAPQCAAATSVRPPPLRANNSSSLATP